MVSITTRVVDTSEQVIRSNASPFHTGKPNRSGSPPVPKEPEEIGTAGNRAPGMPGKHSASPEEYADAARAQGRLRLATYNANISLATYPRFLLGAVAAAGDAEGRESSICGLTNQKLMAIQGGPGGDHRPSTVTKTSGT